MNRNEGYRNVIPVPHTIGEIFRESLSVITEKTDQELYFPPVAEEEEEEVLEPEVNYVAVPAEEVEGKNPHNLGWYELNDEVYTVTDDEVPVEGKTYYTVQEQE